MICDKSALTQICKSMNLIIKRLRHDCSKGEVAIQSHLFDDSEIEGETNVKLIK